MEPKAYIVSGDTGEYSDHRAWYVRAFLVEKEASDFCKALNDWCIEHGVNPRGDNVTNYSYNREIKPPNDPDFDTDYTGTTYWVIEVPLGMASEFNVRNR